MEIEEAIEILNNMGSWDCREPDSKCVEAIETILNHLTKQEKMIENAKDRIEYYLMGNSILNDFSVREKELEKLLKILKKAEESE